MNNNNKLLAYKIIDILNKHANNENRLSQKEIKRYLEDDYNCYVSSHTLSDYIQELRNAGIVDGKRGICKIEVFTERELRTLIDGVMYGKHIPKKDADILIKKLKQISAYSMKNKMKYLKYFTGINRTNNEDIYAILDIIDEAIENDFKIKITQFTPLHNGKKRKWKPKIVDPYFVVSDQSRYYLLCNACREEKNQLEPRRIDRILEIEAIKEKRTPLIDVVEPDFELGRYMREHIYMFSGTVSEIIIKIKSSNIGSLIDWCGEHFKVQDYNDEFTTVSVKTNEDAVYYWALQYGDIVEILEPLSLRERIKEGLKNILKKYLT